MSIREGAGRRVAFDTREELGDKIDKLMVMIGKLAGKSILIGIVHLNHKYTKVEDLHLQVRIEVTVREVIEIGTD